MKYLEAEGYQQPEGDRILVQFDDASVARQALSLDKDWLRRMAWLQRIPDGKWVLRMRWLDPASLKKKTKPRRWNVCPPEWPRIPWTGKPVGTKKAVHLLGKAKVEELLAKKYG